MAMGNSQLENASGSFTQTRGLGAAADWVWGLRRLQALL